MLKRTCSRTETPDLRECSFCTVTTVAKDHSNTPVCLSPTRPFSVVTISLGVGTVITPTLHMRQRRNRAVTWPGEQRQRVVESGFGLQALDRLHGPVLH